MSASRFDFYAARLAELIGPVASSPLVLDHGAGAGEIAVRLKDSGYLVEASEFFPDFMSRISARGIRVYDGNRLPASRFDVIVANNSMFYVHPRYLDREIRRLLLSLRLGGRLLITDVPVIEKLAATTSSRAKRCVARMTAVYQPELGGFFISVKQLRDAFPSMRTLDSWNGYRSHVIIDRI